MRSPPVILALLLLLAAAAPAHASDGVIEINQARALAGGVSPGDTPGFPVTLSAAGKYQLTSNLDLPSGGGGGIQVTAAAVTVDLNGFAITCNPPVTCALPGIEATPDTLQNITVRNGVIRSFSRGVSIGNYSLVEKITANANAFNGIRVNVGSVVRDCIVTANGGTGISGAGGGHLIVGNLVDDNGQAMCTLGATTAYRDNVFSSNFTLFCASAVLLNMGGNLCDSALCP
jgi:hypothetical protein